jgi:hypothetical protein
VFSSNSGLTIPNGTSLVSSTVQSGDVSTFLLNNVANSGTTTGFTVNVTSEKLSFVTNQPINTNQVNIVLSGSGTVSYSQSGFFRGTSAIWSTPLQLNNMRISAVARIYLPSTNFGTYRCSLYSANGIELAYKQVNSLP